MATGSCCRQTQQLTLNHIQTSFYPPLPPPAPLRGDHGNKLLCYKKKIVKCFLAVITYINMARFFFYVLLKVQLSRFILVINRLTPNDPYMGRTAPLTSKRCILYIYSTNIGTEYFKHALYSPFSSLQNAVCFIMLTCFVPVLFTFYIQDVVKLKKIIPAPKG